MMWKERGRPNMMSHHDQLLYEPPSKKAKTGSNGQLFGVLGNHAALVGDQMLGQPSTIVSPLGSSLLPNQGTPIQLVRNSSNQQVDAVSSWGQRGSQLEE